MGLSPKCIVKAAIKQGHTPTDAELTALGEKVPLAKECIACPLRAQSKLTDNCYITVGSANAG